MANMSEFFPPWVYFRDGGYNFLIFKVWDFKLKRERNLLYDTQHKVRNGYEYSIFGQGAKRPDQIWYYRVKILTTIDLKDSYSSLLFHQQVLATRDHFFCWSIQLIDLLNCSEVHAAACMLWLWLYKHIPPPCINKTNTRNWLAYCKERQKKRHERKENGPILLLPSGCSSSIGLLSGQCFWS